MSKRRSMILASTRFPETYGCKSFQTPDFQTQTGEAKDKAIMHEGVGKKHPSKVIIYLIII